MKALSWKKARIQAILIAIGSLLLVLPDIGAAAEGAGASTETGVDEVRYLAAAQIEAGDTSAYAIGTDGTVWAWGGGYSSLGHGATTPAFLPVRIAIDHVRQISAGYRHTLFLKEDGTVWSAGGNEHGQLGIGKQSGGEEIWTAPEQVPGLTDVIQVSAGDDHSLAVKRDGTVWAWGGNEHGQLGDESRKNGLLPKQVAGLPSVNKVAAGKHASVALGNGGEVWVWGYRALNKDDVFHGYIRKPTLLPGGRECHDIAADSYLGAALDFNGKVWVWENYSYFHTEGVLVPHQMPNISKAVSFTTHSAVDADGSAWQWIFDDGKFSQIKALGLPVKVKAISEGSRNLYVLTANGGVYSAGYNQFGQTGQGTTAIELQEFSPVRKAATIRLNGVKLEPTVPPLIVNGATYVPLRGVLEAMGADIRWDIPSRSVIAVKDGKRIVFNTVSGQTTVDAKAVTLAEKPFYAHNSLLVPLRFISETLGAKVEWNGTDYAVDIRTQ